MVMRIGVETGLQRAQAVKAGQLRVNQRHQVIPTLERLVVGIAIMRGHNLRKPPSVDRFKQADKNAIGKPHARLLLCLDNQKAPICIG